MTEISAKDLFKSYLSHKKMATQNLTKNQRKELEKMEESAILKKVQRRQQYATDDEFRSKQQASARKSMAKSKGKKKTEKVIPDGYESNQPEQQEHDETQYEVEQPQKRQPQKVQQSEPDMSSMPKKSPNQRRLF
jgi:hypothetical protein